jgi:RNA polymerase sigma-70 factor (ECF subfamily)
MASGAALRPPAPGTVKLLEGGVVTSFEITGEITWPMTVRGPAVGVPARYVSGFVRVAGLNQAIPGRLVNARGWLGRAGLALRTPGAHALPVPAGARLAGAPVRTVVAAALGTAGQRRIGTPRHRRPLAATEPSPEVFALVERAQAGDAEAFGLLYDRYVDLIHRFIYFRVGSRSLAEDLTADTFLRALKRIGSFTWQGRDLGAWLVTIARNLVADHFKSGRYRMEVATAEVVGVDREDKGLEGNPEAAVVEHLTNLTLHAAVKQLNSEQQECITLRFMQGLSLAETAKTMGKNEGAIKALQYRAVRSLRRLLPAEFTL